MREKHLYEFGPFRLDATDRVLLRDEKPFSLAPKACELLLVLVENNGRVLDKAFLMERVWRDTFVEEANLVVTISALRKALGERPGGGQYIETVPRRGYRFSGSVKKSSAEPFAEPQPARPAVEQKAAAAPYETAGPLFEEDPVAIPAPPAPAPLAQPPALPAPARSRWKSAILWAGSHRAATSLLATTALLVIAAAVYFALSGGVKMFRGEQGPRRLAILPFRNLKPDDQTDFLGFSLANAIITKLGYVNSLIVRPSSYVRKYHNQEIDPRRAASELNVDTLMAGTYQVEGDELRITVQLIDVSRNEMLLSMPITTRNEGLLNVQDQVAERVIDRLQLELTEGETQRLAKDGAHDSLAYHFYLRGVDLYSKNEFREAIDMLSRSVELDPNYAPAWAHLGRAYNAGSSFAFGGRNYQLKAQSAYEQALALNPNQFEAIIFMSNSHTDSNRVEEAVGMLRKLIDTTPNLAEAHWELGYAYRFAGMLNESIEECEKARALDPEVKINSSALNSYLYAGHYDRFLGSLPDKDGVAFILFYRGFGNYYMKNTARAAADFDRAYEIEQSLYTQTGKAISFVIKGKRLEALELLRDIEQGIEETGVSDAEGIYKVAQGFTVAGDRQSALRVLARSIDLGFFCYPYFTNDPLLDNIRGEPEFARIMEVARARHEEFKKRFF